MLLTSLIILQVIPSLISYITIVLKFLIVLSGPSSRSTISDNELSLHRSSLSYHFSPWTASLISSLCCTHGSNNLSLHHCFDLTSSPNNYIFMKSLDKGVVIINILSSSKISIEFLMGNTILAPRWFVLSSATLMPSLQHKLAHVFCITLSSFLPSLCHVLPWNIAIFYVKDVVGISPVLENSWFKWYLSPSPFFSWSPVVPNSNTDKWASNFKNF